jgi:hypothetical protein
MPKNEADEFLNGLDDSSKEFDENTDPFAEETTTEAKEPEEVEEEKPLPFHKDPKVQRYVEKQIAKALEGKTVEKEFVKEAGESVDDYYERLIGNDTPEKIAMIREAKLRDEKLLAQAEERAFSRLTQEQQREVESDRKAEEELDNSLEEIEETFNIDLTSNSPVARKTRVDFMKFVEKIAPKDRNGEITEFPDMNAAFETFQSTRQVAQPSRAKDLAARGVARSGEVSSKPQERVTFDNMDSFFDKLLGK